MNADITALLSLPDGRYFALDNAAVNVLQQQFSAALQPAFELTPPGASRPALREVLAIAGPAMVDLREQRRFPLLVAHSGGAGRQWSVNNALNGTLIAANLSTGAVDAVSLLDTSLRSSGGEHSRTGKPPGPNGIGGAIGVRLHDLMERLPSEALQGRIALTLLDFDRPSNTLAATVRKAADTPERRPAQRRITTTAAPTPTPTQAAAAGVSFVVPPTVAADKPALASAHIRLPQAQLTVVGAPAGSAQPLLLAASLLLVQLDEPAPMLQHLAVPARPVQPTEAAALIDASFSLDLRGAFTDRHPSGHYLAYLVVGSTVTGPQPVHFVRP